MTKQEIAKSRDELREQLRETIKTNTALLSTILKGDFPDLWIAENPDGPVHYLLDPGSNGTFTNVRVASPRRAFRFHTIETCEKFCREVTNLAGTHPKPVKLSAALIHDSAQSQHLFDALPA